MLAGPRRCAEVAYQHLGGQLSGALRHILEVIFDSRQQQAAFFQPYPAA